MAEGGNTGLDHYFPSLNGVLLIPASSIKSLDVVLDSILSMEV